MKKSSNTKSIQSSLHTKHLLNDLLDNLFKSADPLCLEAASVISSSTFVIDAYEKELITYNKAVVVLLDALSEIVKLSIERDNPKKKLTEVEFKKRFREIINICADAHFSYERVVNDRTKTLRK